MATPDDQTESAFTGVDLTPAAEVLLEPEQAPVDELGPDEPRLAPQNASANVSLGETVTVTIPRAAAKVLLNPVGRTLAETSDAQGLLRAELDK